MDEKIEVDVDGVIHIFAKSDIRIDGFLEDGTATVTVNYARKEYSGTVASHEAVKLHSPADKSQVLSGADKDAALELKPSFRAPKELHTSD